jgi:hypothetical protein
VNDPWSGFGDDPFESPNEVTWARGRLPDRTYVHKTFRLDIRNSQDFGQPARFVVKVFDESPAAGEPPTDAAKLDRTEYLVHTTPGGRKQIKIQVAREAGLVRELQIQRVPTTPGATKLETLLTLDREAAGRLIDVVKSLEHIPVDGDEQTVRVDDQTVRALFSNPEAIADVYNHDPNRFRRLIEADATADDLVAIAHRRQVVDRFRALLREPATFSEAQVATGGKPERVWQSLLEANPWILGIGLAGQLLTSWNESRLEQWVAGFSVAGVGKRADAFLRTNGRIKSMVFAEIKHHQTDLLSPREYRAGCWAPSTELAGGVTQTQQTVHLAVQQIGDYLQDKDASGFDLNSGTYLVRPRSFLIIGNLDQLRGPDGGVHRDKFRSLELYRRNLYEPEVITFDELLARAEWHVAAASVAAADDMTPRDA